MQLLANSMMPFRIAEIGSRSASGTDPHYLRCRRTTSPRAPDFAALSLYCKLKHHSLLTNITHIFGGDYFSNMWNGSRTDLLFPFQDTGWSVSASPISASEGILQPAARSV